jgi:hypothetical protein
VYVGILHAGKTLAKWRGGIDKAISEGKTILKISKARLPTLTTPAQVLALDVVDLVEVDVTKLLQNGEVELIRRLVKAKQYSKFQKLAYLL